MGVEINQVLELFAVGMLTVFFILILVVVIGNSIIIFVNKFYPEDKKAQKVFQKEKTTKFNNKKLVAIVSAVDILTQGKGKVIEVKKVI